MTPTLPQRKEADTVLIVQRDSFVADADCRDAALPWAECLQGASSHGR